MIPQQTTLLVAALTAVAPASQPVGIAWQTLEPGLELASIPAPRSSSHGDSTFTVVRVDPEQQNLALLTASELGGGKRTAPGWAFERGLKLVVNAGMFAEDHSTATHYMQNYAHINNGRLRADNAFLVFVS